MLTQMSAGLLAPGDSTNTSALSDGIGAFSPIARLLGLPFDCASPAPAETRAPVAVACGEPPSCEIAPVIDEGDLPGFFLDFSFGTGSLCMSFTSSPVRLLGFFSITVEISASMDCCFSGWSRSFVDMCDFSNTKAEFESSGEGAQKDLDWPTDVELGSVLMSLRMLEMPALATWRLRLAFITTSLSVVLSRSTSTYMPSVSDSTIMGTNSRPSRMFWQL
mmetsp:Transcript_10394/g.19730  ORF Transcript_10394/g.19730 Transcript_10394/m.19730 type:complete len:220 (-) Transcript_10394:1042-1701(-)